MKGHVERTTAWVYTGIWGAMTRWFRVPEGPPVLPVNQGENVESLRPADGFLRYLKFKFWVVLLLVDLAILIGWLIVLYNSRLAGLLLSPVAFAVAVFPDVVAYVSIHLRYDTTWYVMTPRSLRIRRGIWLIHETTITFENVQNIRVDQGPLQRYFGIADLVVETAGGGATHKKEGHSSGNTHRGLIEGIADASGIRDRILQIVMRSKSAGIGDDGHERQSRDGPDWSPSEIQVLREIRDAVRILAS